MNELAIQLHQTPGEGWIDLRTAAERAGCVEGSLRHRLRGWIPRGLARLERPSTGKSRWFVREDADPRFARVKSVEILDSEFDARRLTDAQRRELLFRQATVDNWLLAKAAGVAAGKAEQAVTAAYLATLLRDSGRTISRATLYNWFTGYRRTGLAGLVDKRWTTTHNSPPTTSEPGGDEFWGEFCRLYLDQRQRSVKLCYDRTVDLAEERGWAVPSYKTIQRRLAKVPRKTIDLHRLGSKKYDATRSPFIERDYTRIFIDGAERPMQSNDIWCADHHQFDVWVQVPGREKPVRPWLCGWQDLRSRQLVGHSITPDSPDSGTIIAALRMALIECGTPRIALTDNGKDFDSFALQGETKKQRRARARIRAGEKTPSGGIFGLLKVQVRHAREYNAKSKPIERAFGTLCARFSKLWETYCGGDPSGRPADLDLGKAPPLDDFIASFADWLAVDYHARAHAGHGMDGLSPAAAYERHLVTKRVVDRRLIDSLLMRRSGPLKVGRNGVTYLNLAWGRSALADRCGQYIVLAVDDRDVNAAQAFTLEGRLIGVVSPNERVPFFADRGQVKAALGELKADKRARKEYLERRPRMADSLPDRLYRRRVSETARPASSGAAGGNGGDAPPPPVLPPILSPLRTPLDEQLPAIRSLAEAASMRLAAGGEHQPAAWRFQYTSAADDGGSESPAATFMHYVGEATPPAEDQT